MMMMMMMMMVVVMAPASRPQPRQSLPSPQRQSDYPKLVSRAR
jgi:hypothetical protein